MKTKNLWMVSCLALLFSVSAMADSISPTSVSGTLGVGDSVTIIKTVTVSQGPVIEGTGDVFFLTDTTGSMGDTITAVQTNASAILSGLSAYGNIQTGAGNYQDYPTSPWGGAGDHPYELDSAIDGAATTQTGINNWDLGWGNDGPESQLYALTQAAGGSTGWRTDSEKFVLWFGDAPGHEPSNTAGYPGPSAAETISTLGAAGITVFAFNVGYGNLDAYGQATDITDATGGALYSGFGADIVTALVDAIGEGFANYTVVSIEAPSLAGLDIDITPLSYVDAYDRSATRTFDFAVTFTGLALGTYDFEMFATVDGGRVATESDTFTVVPLPGAVLLGMLGLSVAGLRLRKRA